MALGSVRPGSGVEDRPAVAASRVRRGPWQAARRRRGLPFVGVGGLLVVVCVLAYAWGAVRLGDRIQVLAVARPVAAGQPITAADLTAVSAARDSSVELVPVAQAGQVIGRPAVVPLLAGTLLTPALVGAAAFPPAGKLAASLALKPGQYPQGVAVGARVTVYLAAAGAGDGQPTFAGAGRAVAAPVGVPAVVLGVDLAGDGQGATVITLLLDAAAGPTLAAAAGGGAVVLVQTAAGGD